MDYKIEDVLRSENLLGTGSCFRHRTGKRLCLIIILSYTLLFLYDSKVFSQGRESIIGYADRLFKDGNYLAAIGEFQRAYYFESRELKSILAEKIADSYFMLNEFTRARSFYDSVEFYSDQNNFETSYRFKKILTYIKEKNFGYGLMLLNNFPTNNEDEKRKNLYKGICYFGIGEYENSYYHLLHSIPINDSVRVNRLTRLFESKDKLRRPKSGFAIIFSSFIPGTGQIYSGNLKEGINSLLLLGGMGYLLSLGNPGSVSVLVPAITKYYIGGLVHAKELSTERRKRKQHQFYDQLLVIMFS